MVFPRDTSYPKLKWTAAIAAAIAAALVISTVRQYNEVPDQTPVENGQPGSK